MRLEEFIEETGIPVTKLAYRCNLSFHKVYNVLRGGVPTLKTAIAISEYTKGKVSIRDLLPKEEQEENQPEYTEEDEDLEKYG